MDHLAGSTMDEMSRMTPEMPISDVRYALYTYDKVLLRMVTDAIRKATDQYGLPRMMSVANPASSS